MNINELTNIVNYFSYNSLVIISYFLICLIILILNIIFRGKVNKMLAVRRGNIFNPLNYIRLITTGLCHQDWNHFRNNFILILLVGPMLEEKYGSINLLVMILITTLISSLLHIIMHKSSAIGASDNVYMMIVLCSIVNITNGKIPITLILILLFYVADEIIKLLFKRRDNIAHDSHIIGAICGFIFGYFIF